MKTIAEKKNMIYPVKSSNLDVKDIDMSKRIVTGYYNAFNYYDSDADVIIPGAFSKSITERGPGSTATAKIKHALFHDLTQLPGKIEKLEEDSKGLYFETRMSSTTLGNDTLINYQEGVYDNHSIGFRYIDLELIESDAENWDKILSSIINRDEAEKNGYVFLVKELKLWEGSTVAFGSNSLTPYLGSKSMDKEALQIKLFERVDLMQKQLKHGSQSDETMQDFEIQILQMKQIINEIVSFEPQQKPTPGGAGKEQHEKEDIESVINNFKFF